MESIKSYTTKSGDKHDISNYRPISNIPIFGKIFEKHLWFAIRYLKLNKLLSNFQFGFRKKHSTIDALLYLIKIITTALNKKEKVCVITLDLKKAFKNVDHILLNKFYYN